LVAQKWSKTAAVAAQTWAKKCVFEHDPALKGCGQNIYMPSSSEITGAAWAEGVKSWHSEVSDFTYGSTTNNFADVGHYTQVVWATSNTVGCGFTQCKDPKSSDFPYFNIYVCNYCPA
jgi:Cysteine-rich secretory protein family